MKLKKNCHLSQLKLTILTGTERELLSKTGPNYTQAMKVNVSADAVKKYLEEKIENNFTFA